jgi:hypothetical protein
MLAPALTDFLRASRKDCNARFAAARRRWPRLDAADFSLFLRDQVSPLAVALDPALPGAAYTVLSQAYNIGLQLVAEKLAGPSAASPSINQVWAELFPKMPDLIASSPRRVLVALGNAAHQLAASPGASADIWRRRLADFIPTLSNADQLLVIAQVLAWQAGLPHYRETAIAAADSLPPELALRALAAPNGASWPEIRDAHLSDPWLAYDRHGNRIAPCDLEHRIGAFRGFGGLFLTPPLVTSNESQILVFSGGDAWILVADAFGAALHRAAPEEIAGITHAPTAILNLGGTSVRTSPQSHALRIGPAKSIR